MTHRAPTCRPLHIPSRACKTVSNDGLRNDITESTKTICKHYGIKYIELKNISKKYGHPTAKGMEAIAAQVMKEIK